MGHKNKVSLRDQVKAVLDAKLAIGESRRAGKRDRSAADKIYSWDTYRTYLKHCIYFADWCKEKYRCKSLDDCLPHVAEWMDTRTHLSTYTQKLELSSLAKLYGCTCASFEDFRKNGHGLGISTPERCKDDITRSRGEAVRDKHFSKENNAELIEFCRCCGLRRHELELLTGDTLMQQPDGSWAIDLTKGTKGGRPRIVPIVGSPEAVARVVARMQQAGTGTVWGRVHSAADIHSYRADYAMAVYQMHARPIDQIPRRRTEKGYWVRDVYCLKGSQKGVKLDKQAMLIASQALGHNRIDVIAGHYLRMEED